MNIHLPIVLCCGMQYAYDNMLEVWRASVFSYMYMNMIIPTVFVVVYTGFVYCRTEFHVALC